MRDRHSPFEIRSSNFARFVISDSSFVLPVVPYSDFRTGMRRAFKLSVSKPIVRGAFFALRPPALERQLEFTTDDN